MGWLLANPQRHTLASEYRRKATSDLKVSLETPLGSVSGARTKTDTGRLGEYPKALDRTLVKELGNLTP